jgi:hypothetical protein
VLRGGFVLVRIEFATQPMFDAIERDALGMTQAVQKEFEIFIRPGLGRKENSVTLYHEILEASTLAVLEPPVAVQQFGEPDFERAAYEAYERFGEASVENLNRMLELYGFEDV